MDLTKKICTCLEFQELEIPCRHAVAVCRESGLEPEMFVSKIYSVKEYRETYRLAMHPVDQKAATQAACYAPRHVPQHGRPPKRRLRRKNKNTQARHCSYCGSNAHNRRRCDRSGPADVSDPNSDSSTLSSEDEDEEEEAAAEAEAAFRAEEVERTRAEAQNSVYNENQTVSQIRTEQGGEGLAKSAEAVVAQLQHVSPFQLRTRTREERPAGQEHSPIPTPSSLLTTPLPSGAPPSSSSSSEEILAPISEDDESESEEQRERTPSVHNSTGASSRDFANILEEDQDVAVLQQINAEMSFKHIERRLQQLKKEQQRDPEQYWRRQREMRQVIAKNYPERFANLPQEIQDQVFPPRPPLAPRSPRFLKLFPKVPSGP